MDVNNSRLAQLIDILEPQGISAEDLLAALFMIRAHWNLAAIVWCCRHLTDLMDAFPAISVEPAFGDQARRVEVLRHISNLKDSDVDPHFLGAFISHNRVSETPLRPYSGDSSLCDLLLIRPVELASSEQQHAFRALQAWFVWQTFQHQARAHQPADYWEYLNSQDRTVSLCKGLGTRIYGAFRAIRGLADVHKAHEAVVVAGLLNGFNESEAIELTKSVRLAHSRKERDYLKWRYGGNPASRKARVAEVEMIDRNIGLFLQLIWLPRTVSEANISERRRAIARKVRRIEVARYGSMVTMGLDASTNLMPDGFAIEIHRRMPERKEIVSNEDGEYEDPDPEEDPDDGECLEPETVLFLGTGDPMASWYAAKSMMHHMEFSNAMLPWPHWRLSSNAIAAVLGCVTFSFDEAVMVQRARLTIGLSLLTGRSLEQASKLLIEQVASLPSEDDMHMAISLPDCILHVLAGKPNLVAQHPLPEYCAPWTPTLRLPLPTSWKTLISELEGRTHRFSDAVVRTARQLLAALPSELGVTPRGISGALKLALLDRGLDDLGWVKVITNSRDANLNNLIHYASYDRAEAERRWHEIVSVWTGPLPASPPVAVEREIVGAYQGIEIRKVAEQIAQLKLRFQESVRERHWDSVYNQLVRYLSMWIGLATAGRKVRQPVPGVITADGWALISDKRRPDGSTDRYVPFREALVEQIEVVRALTSALSLVEHSFALSRPDSDHLLDLRVFLKDQQTRPFQPKYLDRTIILRNLPGNWGRKLIRSASPELLGRFKDAGLGHWVRGRHPWTHTSTFPSQEFREKWLALQADMEQKLGFEVLRIDGLSRIPSTIRYPLPSYTSNPERPATAEAIKDEEIEALLLRGGEELYKATFEWRPPSPEAGLALGTDAMRMRARQADVSLAQDAERICEYIRKKTKIPLFAIRPRKRFQKNWMVHGNEFRCLAYFEQQLLPAIERDLTHLPARGEGPDAARIDTGRLIIAAALRGGVVSTSHMDAFLTFVSSDKPIQAIGSARLIELQVRCQRSKDLMRRTLLLEPYLSILVTSERNYVREFLLATLSIEPDKRRHRWTAAVRAYLRSLNVPAEITLAALMGAVRQRIQLSTSPVLAAYASGEILTEDLSVAEFRRLAGLAPLASTHDVAFGAEERDDEDQELPPDLNERRANFALQLCGFQSPDAWEWNRRIEQIDAKRLGPFQELLRQFSLYMLKEYRSRDGDHLGKRVRTNLRSNLTIVWAGLAGFSNQEGKGHGIDEGTLQNLADLTAEHFTARKHHGAWSRFRRFLTDIDADHAGFTIGVLADDDGSSVSAKIISASEMSRIAQLLDSVRSNIGTPENRVSAARHFALTQSTGARRAEIEYLRWLDFDEDMIRIRPYEGRTLKTMASERVIPVAFINDSLRDLLKSQRELGVEKPIDAKKGHSASGDNFFDRVSRAMKVATGDQDIGPHHLRHTKASALMLSMLSNTVNLNVLETDLPWIPGFLPADAERGALLGSAGQCGQGLKAISALLGHLHETTTLRHYIHTLGIGLYAYHLGLPEIPFQTAFASRISSRATLYRIAQRIRDDKVRSRTLRDDLEMRVQMRCDEPEVGRELVFRDETRLRFDIVNPEDSKALLEAQSRFDLIERIDRYLWTGEGIAPEGIDVFRNSLQTIAAIPSGKKGSKLPRHPMPRIGIDGTSLPEMPLPGVAVRNATILLGWLQRLEVEHLADYRWLIHKWLHASDVQEGAMRLDDLEEVSRVEGIYVDPGISMEIWESPVAKGRKKSCAPLFRFRIRFPISGDGAGEAGPRQSGRASSAVRWALTWSSVFSGVERVPIFV